MMKLVSAFFFSMATISILSFLAISCGTDQQAARDPNTNDSNASHGFDEFKALLDQVADGWTSGEVEKSAQCFSAEAIYSEPPDKQLYRGREQLLAFFLDSAGKMDMTMTWHNYAFNQSTGIGFGEFTFEWGDGESHGVVVARIKDGLIANWREYFYNSDLDWETFTSGTSAQIDASSAEKPEADENAFFALMEAVASGWRSGTVKGAAEAFDENALYVDPPDKQIYRGRAELARFFQDSLDVSPMDITWHHLAFNSENQRGFGEYTFSWNERYYHGATIVTLRDGLIYFWREYQYKSDLGWEQFTRNNMF